MVREADCQKSTGMTGLTQKTGGASRREMVVENRRAGRMTESQALPEGPTRVVNRALKGETMLQEERRLGQEDA